MDSGGAGDIDGMTWTVETWLPSYARVEYRYFIGQASQLFADKVIVAKWEAFVSPRTLVAKPTSKPKVRKDLFLTLSVDPLTRASLVTFTIKRRSKLV